jgi:hypothetical protein
MTAGIHHPPPASQATARGVDAGEAHHSPLRQHPQPLPRAIARGGKGVLCKRWCVAGGGFHWTLVESSGMPGFQLDSGDSSWMYWNPTGITGIQLDVSLLQIHYRQLHYNHQSYTATTRVIQPPPAQCSHHWWNTPIAASTAQPPVIYTHYKHTHSL